MMFFYVLSRGLPGDRSFWPDGTACVCEIIHRMGGVKNRKKELSLRRYGSRRSKSEEIKRESGVNPEQYSLL